MGRYSTSKVQKSKARASKFWKNRGRKMAPNGPRAAMSTTTTTAKPAPPAEHPPVKGPHPGYMSIAKQYTLEQKVRRMQKDNGCDPSNENKYRLLGIQLIENVRESLQLPVKTFDTAATYYHKFRLNFRDAEYNYQDAALASLFVACKVEDTIKKSRDILCAAYNIKTPDKPTTSDDKMFEAPSRVVIGLERLILETIGFDFRVRYPQKTITKLVRQLIPRESGRAFMAVAFPMSLDMYKSFVPIKQSSFTMALAILELTALLLNKHVEAVRRAATKAHRYRTSRASVVETMLDLLDLYTLFQKQTRVGVKFELDRLIAIKININNEVDESLSLARYANLCDKCGLDDRTKETPINHPITPGSAPATSPATAGSGSWPGSNSVKRSKSGLEDTLRFVFDAEQERQERETVADHFREDYEEYEIEVEEEVSEPNNNKGHDGRPTGPRHGPHGHGPGSRRDRQGGGWAPYHRGRDHGDRHKGGRKGGHY